MKKQSTSTPTANPGIPPKFEDVFRRTEYMIGKHSAVWLNFMTVMEEDAKMVEQNRFPLPPAQTGTVRQIFEDFRSSYEAPTLVEYEEEEKGSMVFPQQTVDDEIGRGLLELFDALLAAKLQHRHEHLFFKDYMMTILRGKGVQVENKERCTCGEKSEKRLSNPPLPEFSPSEHFGAVHLFRLVYLLPILLPRIRVQPEAMELVYSYAYRLVEFMLKNRERYLNPSKNYRLAQPAYLKRSEEFHSAQ